MRYITRNRILIILELEAYSELISFYSKTRINSMRNKYIFKYKDITIQKRLLE